MEKTKKTTSEPTGWIILAAVCLLVLLFWILTPTVVAWWQGSSDEAKWGQFGDLFGAINALFSGLAFAGLFYAILLQRAELRATKEELVETREVLKSQRLEAEQQNKTLAQQTFDNTFFQLLRLHGEITNEMQTSIGGTAKKGRLCFDAFNQHFHNIYNSQPEKFTGVSGIELLAAIYEMAYSGIEASAGHYFRSVYNIIKFVDQSAVDNKRLYTNLVRAQLSSFELVMLFYNGTSKYGRPKLKPLIERYALLKSINTEYLLEGDKHRNVYDQTAYQ